MVETACLVHDLGHPPFGHHAEDELDSCLRRSHESDGYEGNAQSFRLVTRLAPTRRGLGLDLTRATLNGILKYPWHRHPGRGKRSRKFGYYSSEKAFFEFAREGTDGDRRSLEACIMDHADDVTYSVHDVEDFYRAGVVPLDQLLQPTEARNEFLGGKAVTDLLRKHKVERVAVERFLDGFGPHCPSLRLPYRQALAQVRELDYFVSFLISRFLLVDRIPAMKAEPIRIDPTSPGDVLVVPEEVQLEIGLLKAMMEHYVFHSPRLLASQRGQRRIVRELFEELVDDEAHGARDLLPPYFRARFEGIDAGSEHDSEARLAADVIASLSEAEAIRLHASLRGVPAGAPGAIE